jgi:NAD(P)-dependent dehydrogenase (short-subunit alcohol dehydrogenase family)
VSARGQVAIVTGAGRGIGRSIAQALASDARVAVVARSEDELCETERLIGAVPFRADVTQPGEAERVVGAVAAELGAVTLLVNNAGTAAAIGPVWEVDPADWWRDVETSLRGAFLFSRAVLPDMVRRGQGRIVNVSSYAAVKPAPYLSGYAAAKAALLSFTEALAAETSEHGVRVFAISPGTVRTAMTEALAESEWLPHLRDREWLEPERGARLVAFLASGGADALSGRFLHALDDVEALVARAVEVERDDLYALRLRT